MLEIVPAIFGAARRQADNCSSNGRNPCRRFRIGMVTRTAPIFFR